LSCGGKKATDLVLLTAEIVFCLEIHTTTIHSPLKTYTLSVVEKQTYFEHFDEGMVTQNLTINALQ